MLTLDSMQELQWRAVQARDKMQDGTFVYGVLTTGVYCKPSCGSRKPVRENIRFYSTAQDAAHDGLRACKRCKPASDASLDAHAASIRAVCQYLQNCSGVPIRTSDLARRAGMSVSHFHRTFTRMVGVTPKRYTGSLRTATFKQSLRGGGTVTDAVHASGFGSSSRVYEQSTQQLGMTPAQYGRGGAGVTIVFASVPSPLGRMMLGATHRGLCSVQFGDTHQ